MNEKVFEVTVFPTSSSTEIMDSFSELDDDNRRLYDVMQLSFYGKCFQIGDGRYDIEFIIGRDFTYDNLERGYNNGITFSEMMKGDFSSFIFFLKELFPTEKDLFDKVSLRENYYFIKPFLFRAQSSYQRGKGSTAGGTIHYGDTNSYAIKGIRISNSYSWMIRKKVMCIRIYDTEGLDS